MVIYYYAVKKGIHPGIYQTWKECQKNVIGFPNSVFKKFDTFEKALEFISDTKIPTDEYDGDFIEIENEYTAVAYVDGSYNGDTPDVFSCGVVIFTKHNEITFSRKFKDAELSKMRNVAGEIMGAETAMVYCFKNSIKNLLIYHDYTGISEWCNGHWKTNKRGTEMYKQFYDNISKKVNIDFKHVKAHTGNTYNEMVDDLAKKGLTKPICEKVIHDNFVF